MQKTQTDEVYSGETREEFVFGLGEPDIQRRAFFL